MNETEEKLLKVLFYSPKTDTTSIKKLYDKVKHRNITLQQVKDFVDRQEVTQLYKKPNKITHFLPITAHHNGEILQIDLVDVSNISKANNNVNFLLTCIDVFSRFVWVIPMKNKNTKSIIESFIKVLNIVHPKIINCDKGSEFISKEFNKLLKEYDINIKYVEIGDHHKLGCIDRFVRTLRQMIEKYMLMHNTTKYIDALDDLVYNYNNSINRGIKLKPNEVTYNDQRIINLFNEKHFDGLQSEINFEIGDEVRFIKNKILFEKGSLAHWSKGIHKIIKKSEHTYTLDNNKTYKFYELQKINTVDSLNKINSHPSREVMRKERTNKTRLRREGVDLSNVIDRKMRDRIK